MTKKCSKASSSRNAETSNEVSEKLDWTHMGILDPYDNKSNNLRKEKFEEAKLLFHCDVVTGEPLILNNDNVNDKGWNSKDPDFEFDDKKVVVRDVVENILGLPVGDRLWPNCLHSPIRNASLVNVDDYILKTSKLMKKSEIDGDEKAAIRSAASRTKNKLTITPIVKLSDSVLSLSSDSPKDGGTHLEMSSGHAYAKEFKPPVIRPLLVPSKDLLSKRLKDDKSIGTESSKATLLLMWRPPNPGQKFGVHNTYTIYKPVYEILFAMTLLYITTDRNRLKYENKPQPSLLLQRTKSQLI
ncbi:hypothetical protein AgCh_013038 [Apium graveolens]